MTPEQDGVVQTVRALFEAFAARDAKVARGFLAKDFYAFEHAVRFDAAGLIGLLEKEQGTGTVFEWSVTQPDAGIANDMFSPPPLQLTKPTFSASMAR
jgi:hypothetical protein